MIRPTLTVEQVARQVALEIAQELSDRDDVTPYEVAQEAVRRGASVLLGGLAAELDRMEAAMEPEN